jgi:O-antigen/teichoic acid export membrane protein
MVAGIFSAVGVKAFTLVGQIAAAHFLTPGDYGQVALALSLGSIAGLFAVGSWGILILQSPADTRMPSVVFWAGAMLSAVPIGIVAGAWVLLRTTSHARDLVLSMLVISPVLLSPLTTVYASKLQTSLRLKRIATLQFLEGSISTLALVALAIAGAGSYALAASKGVGAAIALVLYRASTGRTPLHRVSLSEVGRVSRRGLLLSTYLAVVGLVITLPPAIIAMRHDVETAGLIVWALQFALQLPAVLGFAARQVQMALTSSQRLTGHTHDWLSDAAPLLTAGLALAVLQATTAPLLIPLVFPHRWDAAVQQVQMLSIAQVLLPLVTVQSGNALMAGRVWHVIAGALFSLGTVSAASMFATFDVPGDSAAVASMVATGYLIANLGNWLVVELLGRTPNHRNMWLTLGVTAIGGMLLYGFSAQRASALDETRWVALLWAVQIVTVVIASWVWLKMLNAEDVHVVR